MDIKKEAFEEANEKALARVHEEFDDKKVPLKIYADKADNDGEGKNIAAAIDAKADKTE